MPETESIALLRIDLHKQMARTFVASKQRLPLDKYELMEWLMEFTEHMGKMVDDYQTAYTDHLTRCVSPLYITIPSQSDPKPTVS